MTRLPVVSDMEVVAALKKAGYVLVRQRGSHMRMRHPENPGRKPVTVPGHKEVKPGLLRKVVKDANLSVEEFRKLAGR